MMVHYITQSGPSSRKLGLKLELELELELDITSPQLKSLSRNPSHHMAVGAAYPDPPDTIKLSLKKYMIKAIRQKNISVDI